MRALIVAAGEDHPEPALLRDLVQKSDLLIAADGGMNVLRPLGILPDFLVGDFDSSRLSASDPMIQALDQEGKVIRFPVKKDETDLELALLLLKERSVSRVDLVGASGSRLDHTLCNLLLLADFTKRGMDVRLMGKTNRVRFLVPGNYTLPMPPRGWYTSFLTMDGSCQLTLRGFEYPLEHHVLVPGNSLGVSNHVVTEENRVIVESGGCFCFQSRDGLRQRCSC